jgi:DnaJ-class molecular chaperone
MAAKANLEGIESNYCRGIFFAYIEAALTHYDVLGIRHNASSDEITNRSIALSKIWYPQSLLDPRDPTMHTNCKRCKQHSLRIEMAKQVLQNPTQRQAYDKVDELFKEPKPGLTCVGTWNKSDVFDATNAAEL